MEVIAAREIIKALQHTNRDWMRLREDGGDD
jgi:hypothetical protein